MIYRQTNSRQYSLESTFGCDKKIPNNKQRHTQSLMNDPPKKETCLTQTDSLISDIFHMLHNCTKHFVKMWH